MPFDFGKVPQLRDAEHGSESADHTDLQSRWQRNEIELRQLENTRGFDRELSCARIDELLAEQDRIEHELGSAATAEMRRWSGLS
jgi:hypothetical protein